jgi:hypothetical protein
MASWSCRAYSDQQGILIAIVLNFHQVQKVLTFLSFGPKALFGPTKKSDFFGFQGFQIRFLVHIAQHQDILGIGVLDYCRNEPVCVFIKVYIHLQSASWLY